MFRVHNDTFTFDQGSCTGQAQKKIAGDSFNAWMFGVLTDRRLQRKDRAVGIFIRDSIDQQTGIASPTIRAIATAMSRGAAMRAVQRLAAAGHLRIDSDEYPNHYTLEGTN